MNPKRINIHKVDFKINTDGKGWWSRRKQLVGIWGLAVVGPEEYPELRVYFDTQDWQTRKDGLIYTDNMFEKELRHKLTEMGFEGKFSYSEQGMQGDEYVSFDCDTEFFNSFKKIAGLK